MGGGVLPPTLASLGKMALRASEISQHWAVQLAPFLEGC